MVDSAIKVIGFMFGVALLVIITGFGDYEVSVGNAIVAAGCLVFNGFVVITVALNDVAKAMKIDK